MGHQVIDLLLDAIIQREGSKDTNNPNDSGGRTKFGISEKYHPGAWVNGPPTREEAKQIFYVQYLVKTHIIDIQSDCLRNQLADFAVHSGPLVAIQKLQTILHVDVDGNLGPITFDALNNCNTRVVNNLLVQSRVLMLARLVQKRPKDVEFLYGWLSRALSFWSE